MAEEFTEIRLDLQAEPWRDLEGHMDRVMRAQGVSLGAHPDTRRVTIRVDLPDGYHVLADLPVDKFWHAACVLADRYLSGRAKDQSQKERVQPEKEASPPDWGE